MRIVLSLLILVGLISTPSLAANPRIAVLEFSGPMKGDQRLLLSDKVRQGVLEFSRTKGFLVMSRENMAVILSDMGLSLECAEGTCEVETGRNLNAAYVVSGSVVRLSGLWVCTLKVHETQSGALLATGDIRGRKVVELLDQLAATSTQLMRQALGEPEPYSGIEDEDEGVPYTPPPRRTRTLREREPIDDVEPDEDTAERYPMDLDTPTQKPSSVAFRLGWANFQSWNFLTYGFEGSRMVSSTLQAVAGIEAYRTRRILAPELVPVGQSATVTNTMLPVHLGLLYKRPRKIGLRPHFGAEIQIIPGYVKSAGATAVGLRMRTGLNFNPSKRVQLNIDGSLGAWHGAEFPKVLDGMNATGIIVQLAGSAVYAF